MPSYSSKDARVAAAFMTIGLALAAGGCSQKKVQAAAPVAAAPAPETERPMTTAPDTDASPPLDAVTAPPALPAAATPPPAVAMPRTNPVPAPNRPRAEQPNPEAAEPAAHPPAVQISPQLSPGDQASYEHSTNDDLAIAEKNLQQASGRQLSAAQQDLVEKIRSFTGQARDAGKDADWTRAQNLAQKARLLSIELINSL
jgi:hypothetical protein